MKDLCDFLQPLIDKLEAVNTPIIESKRHSFLLSWFVDSRKRGSNIYSGTRESWPAQFFKPTWKYGANHYRNLQPPWEQILTASQSVKISLEKLTSHCFLWAR